MNAAWKTLAYALIALIWLAIPWLALEVYASASLWWIANHNPYILVERGLKPPPADLGLPVPASRELRGDSSTSVNWSELAVTPADDWAVPRQNEDEASIERRRKVFPTLGERDRDYFAVLHNDLVCVFDQAGNITRRYGDWLREGYNNIDEFFRKAKKSNETHYGDFRFTGGGLDLPMHFFYLANPADKSVYGFLDVESLLLDCFARNLPESSPWEVPFFRYKKNLRDTYTGLGTHHVSTNNFGYRGPDITVPKPSGVFRIVCIGGSTTEEGAEDATYPKLLENKLRDAFPGKPIEVINCGVSGMTTVRHLLKLGEYLQFEPDLLLIYEGVNDICRELLVYWKYDHNLLQRLMQYSPFARNTWNRWLFPADAILSRDLNSLTVRNIDAIRRAAAQKGIRTVVCGLATPDWPSISKAEREFFDYHIRGFCAGKGYMTAEVYGHVAALLRTALRQLCQRERLLYIPVEDEIAGGLYYFSDNCHLRPNGIDKKAQVIANALKPYIQPALDDLK